MAYSSLEEVTAFTRYLLGGQAAFGADTVPTLAEVRKFLDRVSAVLDTALANAGLTVPVTQATAKLVCDDWVTARTVKLIELTQRGTGWSDGEGSRIMGFEKLHAAATDFAKANRLGFIRLGVVEAHNAAEGLAYTGLPAESERTDPTDTTLAQPRFKIGMFSALGSDEDE